MNPKLDPSECSHNWIEGEFKTALGTADYRCEKCGAYSWRETVRFGSHTINMPIEGRERMDEEPA